MTEDKEAKTETKEETKEEPVFKLVDVTTQTAPAIQTPEGNVITEGEGIVMLLNEMKEIGKLVE